MLKRDLKQSLCIRSSHIVLSKNATYHCNKLWLLLISYVQTDATLLAINSELCSMLHISSVSKILRDGFVNHVFFKCDDSPGSTPAWGNFFLFFGLFVLVFFLFFSHILPICFNTACSGRHQSNLWVSIFFLTCAFYARWSLIIRY